MLEDTESDLNRAREDAGNIIRDLKRQNKLKQLIVDAAADAAVGELYHLVGGADDEFVVNADLAEFIHQHSCFKPFLIGQDVVEEGGFPCS